MRSKGLLSALGRATAGAAGVVLGACTASCDAEVPSPPEGPGCAAADPCEPMSAVVAMSDQSSSGVGALSLGGATTGYYGVDLGKDPHLTVSRGRAFFVARDLDTVFELSTCGQPICRYGVQREGRRGTTNPQDVAVAPDGTLWIPRFALPEIAILGEGGREIATVPLPDLDGDGNPNASALRIVDVEGRAKAFVALELLDDAARFRSVRPSALAVFDVGTRSLDRTIELLGRNPFNVIVEHEGRFFFTAAGNFDDDDEPDAGIERLDPRAPDEARMLVPETELGGSPTAVAIAGGCGAAIVADATAANATSVVTFDPETGETFRTAKKGGPVLGPSADYDFWAVAWVDGALVVGDRRRGARGYPLHVFDRTGPGCELSERPEPLYVAQKPIALRALP